MRRGPRAGIPIDDPRESNPRVKPKVKSKVKSDNAMNTADNPCIERLQPLLEQRRHVDRRLPSTHGLVNLAVAPTLVQLVAALVASGAGASDAAACDASRRA